MANHSPLVGQSGGWGGPSDPLLLLSDLLGRLSTHHSCGDQTAALMAVINELSSTPCRKLGDRYRRGCGEPRLAKRCQLEGHLHEERLVVTARPGDAGGLVFTDVEVR